MVVAPLVLTVRLEREAFLRLEKERRRFFPADRNLVPAHISMFHALPGELEGRVDRTLACAAVEAAVLRLRVSSMMRLGGGVAYQVESHALVDLRNRLAAEFSGCLSKQDEEVFRPHITIQNKVSPEEARSTYSLLSGSFAPFEIQGVGLCLWRYRNGPWRLHRRYSFISETAIRAERAGADRNRYSGSRMA